MECGSQFSVALTRSGAVFTWGKGDYHRLGHGNDDHVRRPKKVAALQVQHHLNFRAKNILTFFRNKYHECKQTADNCKHIVNK